MKYLPILLLVGCIETQLSPEEHKARWLQQCSQFKDNGGPTYGRCDVNPCDVNCYDKTKDLRNDDEKQSDNLLNFLIITG